METFLRRLEILNFLRAQKLPVSTEVILQHLLDTGYLDEDARQRKSQFRLIQRDLNFLLGDGDALEGFDNDFGMAMIRGQGKSLLWQLDPYANLQYDFERMPAYMALALTLTRKHLSQVLPSTTKRELGRVFESAEEKLQQSEQKLSARHYHRLAESVEFFQRGQSLQAPDFDMQVLDTIYQAILLGRRLRIDYRSKQGNREYDLHPFGVAIMLPKLYLVAVKDDDMPARGDGDFRSFLVHKIVSVSISPLQNHVPEDFHMHDYLEAGHMDVRLDPNDNRLYSLELEIDGNQATSLINDLEESPISASQTISSLGDKRWLLKARVRRTVQLRNWLMILGDQATVKQPDIIRKDLLAHIAEISGRYPK